ncbi:hypothetical protein Q6D67_15575 [Haliea sp. E1-2-M8]|uniref:hypothetical protein n=1 Tax=Haliea sp. E1-2-M8 TaxID=3064706 RepID=UPI00272496EB|nr:hypothetical protein [Haliea sp. E1-2-M8]MDO8863126.1 hypothetical protein [Haliea sp. E1-2-M8]
MLTRRLLVLAAMLLLTGCKIVILSHNVGGVVSASGAHDCPAGQSCQIDVADIHFRETFQALPGHANYRFKGWLKGGRHLCGGMAQACSLSTDNFADYPHLMAILESDQPFFLIPEFERTGPVETAELEYRRDGKPRVWDARGRLVGTLESEPASTRARGVNMHFRGFAQRYILLIEHNGFGYRVSNSISDLVYDNTDCGTEPLPSLILSDVPAMGLVSSESEIAFPVVVGPAPQIYILDPVATPSRATWLRRWNSSDSQCLEDGGASGPVAPLVLTDAVLAYPLTIEGSDVTIIAPFPDSIVL